MLSGRGYVLMNLHQIISHVHLYTAYIELLMKNKGKTKIKYERIWCNRFILNFPDVF